MNIRDAYNQAAAAYRKKYAAAAVRSDDVNLGFSFLRSENPFVLEIGCAYGRDAAYIVTKTNRYIGIDIYEPYIEMARAEVPVGEFQCIDVMDYQFPAGLDAVFAFASLLHSSQAEVAVLLERMAKAINPGGIIFLSLKRGDEYRTSIETDAHSSRRFYYYNRKSILDVTPPALREVYCDERERMESWFNLILQKR